MVFKIFAKVRIRTLYARLIFIL